MRLLAIETVTGVTAIALWDGDNGKPTIHRSKAVGEPPLMLAISVFSAITQAVRAARPDLRQLPDMDAPATAERILRAITAPGAG